jgi:GAF domain-containing protein
MAGHLRRLAMLNDFALTVSSGRNLDQIARRMFALLARAFSTELIILYLLSSDSRLLHEYRTTDGNLSSIVRVADEHRIAPLLASTQKMRLGEVQADVNLPLYERALSGLYIPLRFRGQTIGILCVESFRSAAFNPYDESLLVVVASHLASLADYTRLRDEAEGRARNLGLIHEVVQQVIGLNDPRQVAEITADLLARYFAYELAAVFVADENRKLTIGGFGGASQNVVRRALDVPADLRRRHLGVRIEPLGLSLRGEPVLRHDERRRRRVRVRQRLRREPGCERRLELRAEASLVELLELGLILRVRVDPLDERRDIDFLLSLCEALGTGGVDSDRVRTARRLRLLAVPARRLVSAPGGGDGGE